MIKLPVVGGKGNILVRAVGKTGTYRLGFFGFKIRVTEFQRVRRNFAADLTATEQLSKFW